MTPQAHVCDLDLAPRQRAMPDYQGAANYAYHLDAGKFAALLARHALQTLGVRHIPAHVPGVDPDGAGGIASVATRQNDAIAGHQFIECTAHTTLLIAGLIGVDVTART